MADGGIGESALLSAALESAGTGAAIGGGMSLLTGRDPLEGALMGGLTGGAFGGIGAYGNVAPGVDAFTAETATGLPTVAADATGSSQALTGLQEPPVYSPQTDLSDYGVRSPYAAGSTNGIVGSTGGENVLQNQLGGGMPSGSEPVLATGQGAAGSAPLISSPTAGAATTAAGGGGSSSMGDLMDKAGSFIGDNKYLLGGGLGLAYLMNQERQKYGIPPTEKYSGPLSKFNYNPLTYKPDVVSPPSPLYRAQYAGGGPIEQMSNQNAIGANTGFPQAYMHSNAFATPYQTPISQNVLTGPGDAGVDPYTGEQKMAAGGIARFGFGGFLGDAVDSVGNGISGALSSVSNTLDDVGSNVGHMFHGGDSAGWANVEKMLGNNQQTVYDPKTQSYVTAPVANPNIYRPQYASGGIASLGSYSDGGRMLKGPGDGMSDNIPATIGGKQPARLADGEFVVPADVVSHLGNGSTDAGAKQLYSMMDKVRKARTGRKAQGREINPRKYMPA